MAKDHKRLGEMLIEAKLITQEQLANAIAEQKRTGRLLGATLIGMGLVTEQNLLQVLKDQLGLQLVDLAMTSVDEQALGRIKEELAKKYGALPIEIEGRSTLVVAMADPLNVAALEDLRFHSGMFIRPVLALPSSIFEAIDRYYHLDTSVNEVIQTIIGQEDDLVVSTVDEIEGTDAIDDLRREAEGRPIVRLMNWILTRSVEMRASDIHIEPQDKELVVRLRVDGLLQEVQRLPKWTQSALVSRVKVLSNLDIAEKRLPQDGRLKIEVGGAQIDMRVSTLPLTHGEKVVIRVIDTRSNLVGLDSLGFYDEEIAKVRHSLDHPQGIVLATGPTGSGKSTLLYAALRHLQNVTKNIVTVEDPVERQIRGINQVPVDEKAKKTFAGALRAILRQDPDVIMVGEIRDAETAQIAFRASVTGHLVLSTVHTNDAAGAVTRLIDLKLEPFMVASSLLCVVNMRLVRTLCPRCREPYEADAATLNRFSIGTRPEGAVTLYRGRGCTNCHNTGYHGRIGIFEVLEIDETIRGHILQNAPDNVIRQAAIERGMHSIGEDGLRKVLEGKTTLEEVTRVVYLANQAGKICPACSTVLSQDYEYCPTCGEFVGEHCQSCKRRVSAQWAFCPHCGEDTTHEQHVEERVEIAGRRKRRTALTPGDDPLRKAS
jgi:type IV pilus assembly protein PilB